MKIIKKILTVLIIIIAVLLIAGLFIQNDYSVQREIIINKPKQDVFNYIKLLKNEVYYNKWTMADPNAKKDYKGTDGTVGFIVSWDSENKNVGKGEQEIKSIVDGQRMDSDLRFYKPFNAQAQTYFTTENAEGNPNQTKLTWVFKGNMPYPMNVMRLFVSMDKELGKTMEESSALLKTNLENQ